METLGKLTVRVYVSSHKPDEHGRMRGNWRTLKTWWIDRSEVEKTLAEFYEANPSFGYKSGWILENKFVTEEHIS